MTSNAPNSAPVSQKAVERYKAAKAAIKQWEEVAERARNEIEKALGDNEYGTVRGTAVCRFAFVKSNRLDQKLLDKLYPEVKAECTTVTESRRLTLIETPGDDD